jgi:hypothetical protein
MQLRDQFVSRELRFSIGTDVDSGQHYVSFPVSANAIAYSEYYAISPNDYEQYLASPESALAFVNECRRREHDRRLLLKPGWNRGWAD